ncbi:MAG: L-seryl-tRNA(Sec) selenium transferase [Clostridia bacterium]
MDSLLRSLPKVDELLNNNEIKPHIDLVGREPVVQAIRDAIDQLRQEIIAGKDINSVEDAIMKLIKGYLSRLESYSLKRVLNGTGIVLHTNLGRARLADKAVERVNEVAKNYSNLEYNLKEAKRGIRYSHVEDILIEITKAEDALIVNNNAAAVLLALNTLAKGGEAIVSRGQLIEIGGSFRIPDVMEQSGCYLKEVGTTNKTHIEDFENAINENTAVLLKVHTSNYKILGFSEEVSTQDMASLGNKHSIPLIEDLGSGMIIDTSNFGLSYEPTVPEVINQGADVVTFSGDKLLGGPQAGIIVGKKEYIQKMKKNHLNRALRIDKMTLAALEATLKLYLDEKLAIESIPVMKMLSLSQEELKERAQKLKDKLIVKAKDLLKVDIAKLSGQVGGGALPLDKTNSFGLAINPLKISVTEYEKKLRKLKIPLIAMIDHDTLLVDLRTIHPSEESELIDALIAPLKEV